MLEGQHVLMTSRKVHGKQKLGSVTDDILSSSTTPLWNLDKHLQKGKLDARLGYIPR